MSAFLSVLKIAAKTQTGRKELTNPLKSPLVGRCLLLVAAFALTASAQQLTYELSTNPSTTFAPGGTIPLPTTNVGSTSNVVIRVFNNTIVNGTVSNISVTGAAFTLPQVPTLPVVVPPQGSFVFTIQFAPTQAGTSTGSLVITNPSSSDTLTLSGVGLASQLSFSYTSGTSTVQLNTVNTSVIFVPTAVSQSSSVVFTVTNGGTLPATISSIGIGQSPSPFVLSNLPALPIALAPGASFSFNIVAQPYALSFTNGTLQIDSTVIPLVVSGNAPPPISGYTIGGIGGTTVAPKTQPSITLALGTVYPVQISGVLTLGISGTLAADPAVQFSTGGLTVPFVIPANTTTALFGAAMAASVAFQTGTVASTFTLTPTFQTTQGQIVLTSASPAPLTVAVAPAAPVLVGIQLSNAISNGFSISVTGYTTTRALTNFAVQFTLAPGFSMPQTSFTLNLQQAASIWFQSNSSTAFGGQFIVTVPFTFEGSLPSNTAIQNAFSSVSVNVSNSLGTSNTVQTNVQ